MPQRRLSELAASHDLPLHRVTLLALIFGGSAAMCLATILIAQPADGRRDVLYVVAAVGVVVSGSLWLSRRREPSSWVLQLLLLLYSVIVTGVAAVSHTANEVTSLGPSAIMTCAYAGCFFSRPALWVQITGSIGGYTAGAVLSAPATAWASVLTAAGVAVGLGVVLHQLTTLLRSRALRDSLTGAVSRATWLRIAEGALRNRLDQPVTVAMIDLDEFKTTNDTLGHLAGDRLLSDLAEAWHDTLGMDGLLGRYGGDEFVILFTNTTHQQAVGILARIASAHSTRWTAGLETATASESLAKLLERVDRELRRNKTIPARTWQRLEKAIQRPRE